jgi:radical SAM-linked protein
MVGEKIRLRFRKTDTLRLLSHHDLMRCAERMLRRAEVPFKSTAGFHPKPRLVFALSLPLGVTGHNEVVELELTRPLAADDVLRQLNGQAPAGLTFTSAKLIDLKTTAIPRRAVYRLPLPSGRSESVSAAAADLLAQEKVWVDRSHPKPRRVNIRPYIRGIAVSRDDVELDLWVTQSGGARAEELFRLLGLADVLEAGAVPERTHLEIHDEIAGATDAPPTGQPETAPLEHVAAGAADEDDAATGTWGLSPNGPIVE